MPSLIFAMKIIKHTFVFPKLIIKDGELVEEGTIEETYTFTLLHKGFGIYEELTGRPLMATLVELDGEDAMQKLISKDFIANLACASYVKIVDGKFHNNRATAEEFKKSLAYSKVTEDVSFIKDLVQMAMECVNDSNKSLSKEKPAKKQ